MCVCVSVCEADLSVLRAGKLAPQGEVTPIESARSKILTLNLGLDRNSNSALTLDRTCPIRCDILL